MNQQTNPYDLIDDKTWKKALDLSSRENLSGTRELCVNLDGGTDCWHYVINWLCREQEAIDPCVCFRGKPPQCWFSELTASIWSSSESICGADPDVGKLIAPSLDMAERSDVVIVLTNVWQKIKNMQDDHPKKQDARISFLIYLLDRGHGLLHGLRSLAYLKMIGGLVDLDSKRELLLAIFHDFASHRGRGNHLAKSGEILKGFFQGALWGPPMEQAARLMGCAGSRHSIGFSRDSSLIAEDNACIDRHFDADRLDETFDLDRLVYVNRCAHRSFFDPDLDLQKRLEVCNEMQGRVGRAKCGERGTDTLTILLYSLTRNLRKGSYLTEKARELIVTYGQRARRCLETKVEQIIVEELKSHLMLQPWAKSMKGCVLAQFDKQCPWP